MLVEGYKGEERRSCGRLLVLLAAGADVSTSPLNRVPIRARHLPHAWDRHAWRIWVRFEPGQPASQRLSCTTTSIASAMIQLRWTSLGILSTVAPDQAVRGRRLLPIGARRNMTAARPQC